MPSRVKFVIQSHEAPWTHGSASRTAVAPEAIAAAARTDVTWYIAAAVYKRWRSESVHGCRSVEVENATAPGHEPWAKEAALPWAGATVTMWVSTCRNIGVSVVREVTDSSAWLGPGTVPVWCA